VRFRTVKALSSDVLHGAHIRIDVDRAANQLTFEPMSREAKA
jgi:ATP-dependent Clp protease ATP-binding subunit ClpB